MSQDGCALREESLPQELKARAASYQHVPLNPGQIRLFKILSTDPIIKCTMQLCDIDGCPPYEAVSYCWGSGGMSHRIHFAGAEYTITEHLFMALKSMHENLTPEWLWVDQICINQFGNNEKAVQVSLMGKIYTQAKRTIVWLGPERHKSNLAMEHMEGIAELIRNYEFNVDFATKSAVELGFPHEDEQVWPAIQYLFRRDWFQRLWIIQEAVFSKELIFLCGNHSVPYADMITLVTAHDRYFQLVPDGTYKLGILNGLSKAFYSLQGDVLKLINDFRSGDRAPHGFDTYKVLEFSQNQQCAEPVDRVYAVMGLLEKDIRDKVQANYSEDNKREYWKVYVQFFRVLIPKFLDGAHFFTTIRSGRRINPELPSWCPDLTISGHPSFPAMDKSRAGNIPAEAPWHPQRIMITITADPNCLLILGSPIDHIKQIVPLVSIARSVQFDKLTCRQASDIKAPLMTCLKMAESTKNGPDDWEFLQALVRVLVMNTRSFSADTYPTDFITDDFLQFLDRLTQIINHQHHGAELNSQQVSQGATRYAAAFFEHTNSRAMFLTEGGLLGLCSKDAQVKDEVAIYFNCPYPVIQRSVSGEKVSVDDAESKLFRELLGLCYVDGLMQGEIFKKKDFDREGYSEFYVV